MMITMTMTHALLLDFKQNNPFMYIEKFQHLLYRLNIEVDMFNRYGAKRGDAYHALAEKLSQCELIILRKPLPLLSDDTIIELVHDAISAYHIAVFAIYSFSEQAALDTLNRFLQPYHIQSSSIMVYDDSENVGSRRIVRFLQENNCFATDCKIFDGVDSVVIPHPHHIFVNTPSKPLIRGNSTTITIDSNDLLLEHPIGSEIIVGAYHQEPARLVVIDSTPFVDTYIELNMKFAENIIYWLVAND
jgi:hypothetical protein